MSFDIMTGDVFASDWDVFVHCANLYHTMGGGVAAVVARKFPNAVLADKTSGYGDVRKLGELTYAQVEHCGHSARVVNLYGQIGVGNDGTLLNRNVRYDALLDGLYRVGMLVRNVRLQSCSTAEVVALPWIGCGLAGGSRRIVGMIVEEIADIFTDMHFVIYQL